MANPTSHWLHGTPTGGDKAKRGTLPTDGSGFASADGLSPHDGLVMHEPRVYAVFWGADFGSDATGLSRLGSDLNDFLSRILPSRYFSFLQDYGVAQPKFSGSVWLPHHGEPLVIGNFDDVAPILRGWLDGRLLPESPGPVEYNILYLIFLPDEITFSPDLRACAYHDWAYYNRIAGKANLLYAVIETHAHSFNSLTSLVTHELAEAFTDRDGDGWHNSAEIGDFCNDCGSGFVNLDGFTLASYWRKDVGRCLSQDDLTPPPPPPVKLTPNLNLQPEPVLNKSSAFSVDATDPNTGSSLAGIVKVFQPVVGGRYAQVAAFRAPGSTPRPLRLSAVFGRNGAEPRLPYIEFDPDDNAHYDSTQLEVG